MRDIRSAASALLPCGHRRQRRGGQVARLDDGGAGSSHRRRRAEADRRILPEHRVPAQQEHHPLGEGALVHQARGRVRRRPRIGHDQHAGCAGQETGDGRRIYADFPPSTGTWYTRWISLQSIVALRRTESTRLRVIFSAAWAVIGTNVAPVGLARRGHVACLDGPAPRGRRPRTYGAQEGEVTRQLPNWVVRLGAFAVPSCGR